MAFNDIFLSAFGGLGGELAGAFEVGAELFGPNSGRMNEIRSHSQQPVVVFTWHSVGPADLCFSRLLFSS